MHCFKKEPRNDGKYAYRSTVPRTFLQDCSFKSLMWIRNLYFYPILTFQRLDELTKEGRLQIIQPTVALSQLYQRSLKYFKNLYISSLSSISRSKKILFQLQFGFRRGHSKAEAITEITNTLRKAIDSNLNTCGVVLDFSKTLDTVNHKILLGKLEAYGIRGMPLNWFQSYLSNRKQYVELDGIKSQNQTI